MLTREEKIFAEKIEFALQYVVEPYTIEQLCENCKELSGRPEKVKKCLDYMCISDIVEKIEDEYMLSKNVTEEIRDKWLKALSMKGEEAGKRKSSYTCYADVVKRRTSAPGGIGGACGSDSMDSKVYKRSASDIFPCSSSGMPQAAGAREGRPVEQQSSSSNNNNNNSVAISHHYHHEQNIVVNQYIQNDVHINDCDFSSTNVVHAGDKANLQFGDHNEMNFQAPPEKHKKRKKRK